MDKIRVVHEPGVERRLYDVVRSPILSHLSPQIKVRCVSE